MVLSQPNPNRLEPDRKQDPQEAAGSRALKRVKRSHSHPPPGSRSKGKEINAQESENEDPTSIDLDDGLNAAPNDIDGIAREYARTGKYKRSMYVDAFNLALDIVLQDELQLFSDEEQEVFAKYRSLEYEPQFLYVRLFLRKTSAWFRESKLGYYDDITDIHSACQILQSSKVAFAESENCITTLEEAANLLNLEELKSMAKEAKCAGPNKAELVAALKKASGGQVGLGSKGQLKLSFDKNGNYITRDSYFVRKILEKTGPLIRLNSTTTTLFGRVHLVFYRSSEWTEKSLTTVILARTQRRNFPDYIVSRTSNVFPTRASLLDFEESIKLQSLVDEILGNNGVVTNEGLEKVKTIFEGIYEKWKRLIAEDQAKKEVNKEQELERLYLRRFSAAWVLTRIVHKGEHVLGRLKEYGREHKVLTALLAQRGYHSARRGGWYQRKALIEEHYMAAVTLPKNTSLGMNKKLWLRKALQTCEAGLQDSETHLIYHYDLQKRITKLEPKLHVSKRDQHDFGHTRLAQPSERSIVGEIQPGDSSVGKKTTWVDKAEGGECSVEEMCLSRYRAEGWKGFHSEGGIIKTLFAYLFYDIMFLYLPNVFQTQFQMCPLDLFTDGFYPARASEINHRLVELSNGGAAKIIEDIDREHRERKTCVVGLDWSFSKKDLLEIVDVCPPSVILQLRLFSELTLRGISVYWWRYSRSYLQSFVPRIPSTRIRFPGSIPLEPGKEAVHVLGRRVSPSHPSGLALTPDTVKSENDRLSDKQRLWIHVLSGAGMKVQLCAAIVGNKKNINMGKVANRNRNYSTGNGGDISTELLRNAGIN